MPETSSIVGDLRKILEEAISPSITTLKLQVEQLQKDVNKLETKLEKLEVKIDSKMEKLDTKIDSRFDRLEQMISLTLTVHQVQERLARIEEREKQHPS